MKANECRVADVKKSGEGNSSISLSLTFKKIRNIDFCIRYQIVNSIDLQMLKSLEKKTRQSILASLSKR
jgi:hypothetical protein